jgi:competence protein ComEC
MNEEIHRKGLASLTLIAGEYIMLERGIRLSALHPPVALLQGTGDDINNNTSVLRLEWDKVSFLLTSDIAEDAEKYLLQNRANLRSSVLKVAHHGSRGSTCDSFLAAVHPSAAVISAGEGNRFGHPHREIIDRLATQTGSNRVYNTILDGSIEFITDGKKLWCRTEHAR